MCLWDFRTHLFQKEQWIIDHLHEWWRNWSRWNLFQIGKTSQKPAKTIKKNYENIPVLVKRASSNTPRGSIEAEARDSISTGQKRRQKSAQKCLEGSYILFCIRSEVQSGPEGTREPAERFEHSKAWAESESSSRVLENMVVAAQDVKSGHKRKINMSHVTNVATE